MYELKVTPLPFSSLQLEHIMRKIDGVFGTGFGTLVEVTGW